MARSLTAVRSRSMCGARERVRRGERGSGEHERQQRVHCDGGSAHDGGEEASDVGRLTGVHQCRASFYTPLHRAYLA